MDKRSIIGYCFFFLSLGEMRFADLKLNYSSDFCWGLTYRDNLAISRIEIKTHFPDLFLVFRWPTPLACQGKTTFAPQGTSPDVEARSQVRWVSHGRASQSQLRHTPDSLKEARPSPAGPAKTSNCPHILPLCCICRTTGQPSPAAIVWR